MVYFQKGDVVTVDGGIISSLKGSRYNDEFEFQPPSKKSANDACCNVEQVKYQVMILQQELPFL